MSAISIITAIVVFIATVLKIINTHFDIFKFTKNNNTADIRDLEEEQDHFQNDIKKELKEMSKTINDLVIRISVVEENLKTRRR